HRLIVVAARLSRATTAVRYAAGRTPWPETTVRASTATRATSAPGRTGKRPRSGPGPTIAASLRRTVEIVLGRSRGRRSELRGRTRAGVVEGEHDRDGGAQHAEEDHDRKRLLTREDQHGRAGNVENLSVDPPAGRDARLRLALCQIRNERRART